jgi:acetyl/propionyl-CoA carboxylase alpha subunit
MFAEQLEVEHGISEGCRLVVEFDSVPTTLVIWEESRGTARLQFSDKTSP